MKKNEITFTQGNFPPSGLSFRMDPTRFSCPARPTESSITRIGNPSSARKSR